MITSAGGERPARAADAALEAGMAAPEAGMAVPAVGELRGALPIPSGWPEPAGQPCGDPGDCHLVARYAVAAESGSPKEARDFTAGTLRRWGMAELCRDAIVVISELVTNALRHARPPESAGPDGRRPIEVILFGGARQLLCVVTDPCQRSPVLQEPGYAAENGRGLHVVASLSDRWGWLPLGRGGKAVWAALGRPVPEHRPVLEQEPAMASCEDDNC